MAATVALSALLALSTLSALAAKVALAQEEKVGKQQPTNESTTMVEAMVAVVEVEVASVAAFFLMKSLLVETTMTSMTMMMTTERARFRKSRRVQRRKWRRKCRLTHTRRKGKKRR